MLKQKYHYYIIYITLEAPEDVSQQNHFSCQGIDHIVYRRVMTQEMLIKT